MLDIKKLQAARHLRDWIRWRDECLKDPHLFNEILNTMLNEETASARIAGEIIRHVFDKQPSKLQPYTKALLRRLHQTSQPGIQRSILHCAQYLKIPEDEAGAWFDEAMNIFTDRKKAIAVRVFAMTTCYNIVKDIPELYNELCQQIQHYLPNESQGFKNRGQKILSRTWS